MSGHVLITGGSGLIGTRLTELLLEKGYTVAHLTRQLVKNPLQADSRVKQYLWDVAKGTIDEKAVLEADYLIHLAGAGIADERWSDHRKRKIIDSRVQSTRLLAQTLRDKPHSLKAFICASAIGYYGADTGDRVITEASPAGNDFLADVTKRWEMAADEIAQMGIRTVKLRTGIVLSEKGGALAKLVQPIRLGAGAPLGSGKQYLAWIHLDDMSNLYAYALESSTMAGVYNAVAPNPVTNEQLTKLAAQVLDKPLWLPHVPAFALRIALGEMAVAVLGGNRVMNQRIKDQTDFVYHFSDAGRALEDLLKRG